MRRSITARTGFAAIGAFVIGCALSGVGALAATSATGIWSVAKSPNRGSDFDRLNAVAAVSGTDAWAVGLSRSTPSSQYRTLAEHFDGSAWRIVKSPNVGSSTNELNAVDADSSTDVWAVGEAFRSGADRTLAEHYDGNAWSVVATRNRGTGSNRLRGVAVVTPTDVWAVGSFSNPAPQALAEHYDGTAWSLVSVPDPAGGFLSAVAAVSSTDVWAVGGTGDDGDTPLVEHWNGMSWKIVKTPSLPVEASFTALTAAAANDVWAVGHRGGSTLTEHWDGSRWSVVPSPDPLDRSHGNNFLTGVVELSPTNVWAAGGTLNFTAGSLRQTVTLHFNGSTWSVVPSPNRGTGDNALLGLAAAAPGKLIAAGSYRPTFGGVDRTLIIQTDQA